MNPPWKTFLWQQFGAALDMLDNAIAACPDHLWREPVWVDPTSAAEYSEYWFIAYHTLFWTDLYLSGVRRENFTPPAPFLNGRLPEKPYSKEALQTYLANCREKCRMIFESLTDEKANQPCEFPWGEAVSYAELQLYSMRHVQEHASQLSLILGHKQVPSPDWVARAEHKNA
ncbi:MAG TPA: DinB family protein [Anaerolineales bacterium]|nr:DinB family protein [Anaerolineales bacterium]